MKASEQTSEVSYNYLLFSYLLAILIDRKDLVRTTLIEFSNRPLKVLKQKTKISFQGESGIDAGI